MYSQLSVKRFLAELASDHPCPGGGSAACLVGALGISLALMVGRILGKKKKNEAEVKKLAFFHSVLRDLDGLQKRALRSIDGDIRAYQKVVAAYSLRKGSPGRLRRIEQALAGGYFFQKNFALSLLRARWTEESLARAAKGSIASDLVLSRYFIQASFRGAVQTAKINLEYMKDQKFRAREFKALSSLEKKFSRRAR